MEGIFSFSTQVSFTSNTWIFILPLVLMLVDFISGFLNAWVKNEIDSSTMRMGLVKKLGEVLMLVVAEVVMFGTNFPYNGDVVAFISIYLSLMELISIFENLALLGVPIPGFINTALKQTQNKLEKETFTNENSGNGDSGDSTSSDE